MIDPETNECNRLPPWRLRKAMWSGNKIRLLFKPCGEVWFEMSFSELMDMTREGDNYRLKDGRLIYDPDRILCRPLAG